MLGKLIRLGSYVPCGHAAEYHVLIQGGVQEEFLKYGIRNPIEVQGSNVFQTMGGMVKERVCS